MYSLKEKGEYVKRVLICMMILSIVIIFTKCWESTSIKEEVILKENGKVVKIYDNKIREKSKDERYCIITKTTSKEEIPCVFDLKEEVIYPEENSNLIEKFKLIDKKDGTIEVRYKSTGNLFYTIDLVKEGYLEKEDTILELSISNTSKYLFINGTNKSIILNMEDNKLLNLPCNIKLFSVIWSDDDSKVILDGFFKEKEDLIDIYYIWDMKSNELVEVKDDIFEGVIKWTQDDKYVYYKTYREIKGKNFYTIVRYSIENKKFEDIYSSEQNAWMEEDSIKWVSENEVIFVERRTSYKLFTPNKYFAVKFNLKTKKVREKKLDTDDLRFDVWSFDNKYIYFFSDGSLWKTKVDFDK